MNEWITYNKWVRLGLGKTIIYNKIDIVFTTWACKQVVPASHDRRAGWGVSSRCCHDGLASGESSRRVTAPNTSRVTQGKYGREKKIQGCFVQLLQWNSKNKKMWQLAESNVLPAGVSLHPTSDDAVHLRMNPSPRVQQRWCWDHWLGWILQNGGIK